MRAWARTLDSQLWKSASARCSSEAANSATRSRRKAASGPSCSAAPLLLPVRPAALVGAAFSGVPSLLHALPPAAPPVAAAAPPACAAMAPPLAAAALLGSRGRASAE